MEGMNTTDKLLIWVGAVPTLFFGVAALLADQLAIAIGNLVCTAVMLAVAFWPKNSKPTI
jgi:hypothetical protein